MHSWKHNVQENDRWAAAFGELAHELVGRIQCPNAISAQPQELGDIFKETCIVINNQNLGFTHGRNYLQVPDWNSSEGRGRACHRVSSPKYTYTGTIKSIRKK